MRHRAVFIGLGSNLDDPEDHIRRAVRDIDALPGVRLRAASGLYRSAPLGGLDQPDYRNAAIHVETEEDPDTLFARLQEIERRHGREADHGHWESRTLDLDLLLWGDEIREDTALRLPHPGIAERPFVLAPLCELDPRLQVPGLGSVSDLLRRCPQEGTSRIGSVWRLPDDLERIAVEGLPGSGKTALCNLLAGEFDARLVLENYGSNPFLDTPAGALAAQLHFLTHRVQRFSGITHPDLFQRHTVMDFTLARGELWARQVLSADEYDVWLQVYSHLRAPLPDPDLVVLLQMPPEYCPANGQGPALRMLAHDMRAFFDRMPCAVLTVDVTDSHPARDPLALRNLLQALGEIRPGQHVLLDPVCSIAQQPAAGLSLAAS